MKYPTLLFGCALLCALTLAVNSLAEGKAAGFEHTGKGSSESLFHNSAGNGKYSREVMLGGRLGLDEYVKDENALLPGVDKAEYFAIRSADELEAVRKRLHLPELFAKRKIDFATTMVIGSVDGRQSRKVKTSPRPDKVKAEDLYYTRRFHIHRYIDTPEGRRVEVISYKTVQLKKKAKDAEDKDDKTTGADGDYTPYFFALVERTDKPVTFFRNSDYATSEDEQPLTPGEHHELITFEGMYDIFIPKDAKGPIPLLVVLHGSTINGDRYMNHFRDFAQRFGFAVLAPSMRNGYYWQPYYDYGLIFDEIARVEARYNIDHKRIYAGGTSAGGHSVYSFVLDHALSAGIHFKAFFSLCGRLNPAVSDEVVQRSKDMPIFLMSGDADKLVPLKAVKAGLARLKQAGADVSLRVIEGGDHRSPKNPENMIHTFEWLTQVDKRVQQQEQGKAGQDDEG